MRISTGIRSWEDNGNQGNTSRQGLKARAPGRLLLLPPNRYRSHNMCTVNNQPGAIFSFLPAFPSPSSLCPRSFLLVLLPSPSSPTTTEPRLFLLCSVIQIDSDSSSLLQLLDNRLIMSAVQLAFVTDNLGYTFTNPMLLHQAMKAAGADCYHPECNRLSSNRLSSKRLANVGDKALALVLTTNWYESGGDSGKVDSESALI